MSIKFDHVDKAYVMRLVEAYAGGFGNRLMPILSKEAIKQESDKAADEYYHSVPGTEWGDPADAAEAAWEHGFEIYEDLDFVRQQLLQLGVAGLYHLWERTIKELLRIKSGWRGGPGLTKGWISHAEFPSLLGAMIKAGLVPSTLTCRPKLNELRLVANTVKHGDGKSCNELYGIRPELFSRSAQPDKILAFFVKWRGAASADDLHIMEEHFDEYVAAIRAFWDEVTQDSEDAE